MKIIFWNIGKILTTLKMELLSEIIKKKPDVICIAEGSSSINACNNMVKLLESKSYYCYYSPLFYKKGILQLPYKYISNGVKIFIKNEKKLTELFTFSNQREDGRIVVVKHKYGTDIINLIFLHNLSKSGNRETTLEQVSFIKSLHNMIKIGKVIKSTDKYLIIGDFNLEPWDNILRHKDFLNTNFLKKHHDLTQRLKNPNKLFNHLPENIIKSSIKNLGGTYYTSKNGWALFDYVLGNPTKLEIDFNILTQINKNYVLLKNDNSIKKDFLNYKLDHLPILINFNK